MYFILTILITEGWLQPSILSDCNFNSFAGEVSGTQAGLWGGGGGGGGVEPVHRYGTRRAKKGHMNLWRAPLTFYFDFFIIMFFLYFQLKSTILREVSVCPRAPKQYCYALQNFSWRPWYKVLTNHYVL